MSNQRELSDPLTMRLPCDVLKDIEEIAAVYERSRSWVFVRALKSYLAAEGKEILEIAKARREITEGNTFDLDDVITDVDAIVSISVTEIKKYTTAELLEGADAMAELNAQASSWNKTDRVGHEVF